MLVIINNIYSTSILATVCGDRSEEYVKLSHCPSHCLSCHDGPPVCGDRSEEYVKLSHCPSHCLSCRNGPPVCGDRSEEYVKLSHCPSHCLSCHDGHLSVETGVGSM